MLHVRRELFFLKGFWKILNLKISCGIFLWILNGSLFSHIFCFSHVWICPLQSLLLMCTQRRWIVCEAGHFSLNNELCFYLWKCFVCSAVLASVCTDWHTYRCSTLLDLKADGCASYGWRKGGKRFSTAGIIWVQSLVQLVLSPPNV